VHLGNLYHLVLLLVLEHLVVHLHLEDLHYLELLLDHLLLEDLHDLDHLGHLEEIHLEHQRDL
jgi:hypothetical protein